MAFTSLGLPGTHVLKRECNLRYCDLVEASGVPAGKKGSLNATLIHGGEVRQPLLRICKAVLGLTFVPSETHEQP